MPETIISWWKISELKKLGSDEKSQKGRIDYYAQQSATKIKNQSGWPADKLTDKGINTVFNLMTKAGKEAEFCVSFDGGVVRYFVKVGADRTTRIDEFDFLGYRKHADRKKLMDWMLANRLATAQQASDAEDRDSQD